MEPQFTGALSSISIVIAGVILFFQNRKNSRQVQAVQDELPPSPTGVRVRDQLNRIELEVLKLSAQDEIKEKRILDIEDSLRSIKRKEFPHG